MRAISRLSLDAGISTVSWAAMIPLRIRVRKSAMGSVIDMGLPARLRHAGDEALMRQLAQAEAAQAELAVDRARAPAPTAARMLARLVLGRALRGDDLGCLSHSRSSLLSMRRPGRCGGSRTAAGARRGRRAGRARPAA